MMRNGLLYLPFDTGSFFKLRGVCLFECISSLAGNHMVNYIISISEAATAASDLCLHYLQRSFLWTLGIKKLIAAENLKKDALLKFPYQNFWSNLIEIKMHYL